MLLQKRLVLKISKTLISQEEIKNKISEIAEIINSKYKDEELVVIGILKGAFIVVSDLAKQLQIDVTFDFMSIKSYYGSESSGQIKIIKDLEYDISNKNHYRKVQLCRQFRVVTKREYCYSLLLY